jgi:hypothetical protein
MTHEMCQQNCAQMYNRDNNIISLDSSLFSREEFFCPKGVQSIRYKNLSQNEERFKEELYVTALSGARLHQRFRGICRHHHFSVPKMDTVSSSKILMVSLQ